MKSKAAALNGRTNEESLVAREHNLETSILSKVSNINQSIRMNLKTYNGLFEDYQVFKRDVNRLKSKRFTNILQPLRDKPSVNISKEMSIFERLKSEDKFGLGKLKRDIKVADVMFNLKYDVFQKNAALVDVIKHYEGRKEEQKYYKDVRKMFLRKKKLKGLENDPS